MGKTKQSILNKRKKGGSNPLDSQQLFRRWVVRQITEQFAKRQIDNVAEREKTRSETLSVDNEEVRKENEKKQGVQSVPGSTCDPNTIALNKELVKPGKIIGKGGFKIVYEACSEHPDKQQFCLHPYVLSFQSVATAADRLVVDKELFFGNLLGDLGLAPKILANKRCETVETMLVEKMDITAYDLGKKQTLQFFGRTHSEEFPVLVFNLDQFTGMMTTIFQVSKQGIVHGDLMLDNLMTTHKDNTIWKVIDFGLSGDYKNFTPVWGFTHVYGCTNEEKIPEAIGIKANIWQFFQSMLGAIFVFIWDSKTHTLSLVHNLSFPQYQDVLDDTTLAEIGKNCSNNSAEIQQVKKELAQEALMRNELMDANFQGMKVVPFKILLE